MGEKVTAQVEDRDAALEAQQGRGPRQLVARHHEIGFASQERRQVEGELTQGAPRRTAQRQQAALVQQGEGARDAFFVEGHARRRGLPLDPGLDGQGGPELGSEKGFELPGSQAQGALGQGPSQDRLRRLHEAEPLPAVFSEGRNVPA